MLLDDFFFHNTITIKIKHNFPLNIYVKIIKEISHGNGN